MTSPKTQSKADNPAGTSRVLRYTGKDPSAVDPYWDFEHLPGELYDSEALRVWRLRVFVSKPARARLSIARTEDTAEGIDAESDQHPLTAHDHILRYNGGPEREAPSYERLTGSLVAVSPPSTTFAINLTALDAGAFLVRANVLGAQQQEREMKFRIVRRPFYTYSELQTGKVPIIRSSSGIHVVEKHGRRVEVATYRWSVDCKEWSSEGYGAAGVRQVVCTAEISARAFEWSLEDVSKSIAVRAGHSAETYTGDMGLGLPFPRLVGIAL